MAPGFFGKIADRLTLVALRGVLREIRQFRQTLEIGIDSYRQVHGLPLVFGEAPAEVDEAAEKQVQRGSVIRPGDFQTVWLIEELAREHRVPVTVETDLEQLALERGWLTPDGDLTLLPEAARGLEVER